MSTCHCCCCRERSALEKERDDWRELSQKYAHQNNAATLKEASGLAAVWRSNLAHDYELLLRAVVRLAPDLAGTAKGLPVFAEIVREMEAEGWQPPANLLRPITFENVKEAAKT